MEENRTVMMDDGLTMNLVKPDGFPEMVRKSMTESVRNDLRLEAEDGNKRGFKQTVDEITKSRRQSAQTPTPIEEASYGTTEELFSRLQKAIAEQACVPEQTSDLLTYWTISTWLSDALSVAPCLAIVGPPHEGDQVLRTLRSFCRSPLLFMGATLSCIKSTSWLDVSTMLFYDPDLTKRMALILGGTTNRNYIIDDVRMLEPREFFGPKAIYLGEEVSVDRTPRYSLQVHLSHTTASPTQKAAQRNESPRQEFQNQLLGYRQRNLDRVYNSEFDSGLGSETGAIANSLGACIVDCPELQSKLISQLTPVENVTGGLKGNHLRGAKGSHS